MKTPAAPYPEHIHLALHAIIVCPCVHIMQTSRLTGGNWQRGGREHLPQGVLKDWSVDKTGNTSLYMLNLQATTMPGMLVL